MNSISLPHANELRKEKILNDKFFLKVQEQILKFKSHGEVHVVCDKHVCSENELHYCLNILDSLEYNHSFYLNSHGIKTLKVTW